MTLLSRDNEKQAEHYMHEAAQEAKRSLCLRSQCGSVIVKDGEIIGRGYNAPPLDYLDNRMCEQEFHGKEKIKYDRTCCMHAEWRALLDALAKSPDKIKGATLYFMRLDESGAMTHAGDPFCTVCSRFALDCGLAEFVLWQDKGIAVFNTREYNALSYAFHI